MAPSATHTQTVEILGNQYTLRGHADPERMLELARYVDDKLRQARARADMPQDMTKVAILTSLNIAFELFAARRKVEDEMTEAQRRTSDLVDQLERCLKEGTDVTPNGQSG